MKELRCNNAGGNNANQHYEKQEQAAMQGNLFFAKMRSILFWGAEREGSTGPDDTNPPLGRELLAFVK